MTNDSAWRELYRVALLELRTEELQRRIAAAEEAIQQRIVDLRRCDSSSGQEMQELNDAMRGLRLLASTECKSTGSTVSGLVQGRVTS